MFTTEDSRKKPTPLKEQEKKCTDSTHHVICSLLDLLFFFSDPLACPRRLLDFSQIMQGNGVMVEEILKGEADLRRSGDWWQQALLTAAGVQIAAADVATDARSWRDTSAMTDATRCWYWV